MIQPHWSSPRGAPSRAADTRSKSQENERYLALCLRSNRWLASRVTQVAKVRATFTTAVAQVVTAAQWNCRSLVVTTPELQNSLVTQVVTSGLMHTQHNRDKTPFASKCSHVLPAHSTKENSEINTAEHLLNTNYLSIHAPTRASRSHSQSATSTISEIRQPNNQILNHKKEQNQPDAQFKGGAAHANHCATVAAPQALNPERCNKHLLAHAERQILTNEINMLLRLTQDSDGRPLGPPIVSHNMTLIMQLLTMPTSFSPLTSILHCRDQHGPAPLHRIHI